MTELREVYRVLPHGHEERIRMAEIKAGDYFRILAPEEGLGDRVFEALRDAHEVDGVWGVTVQCP